MNYKIYCFWLNEEEMSDNRKKSLDNLRNVTDCEIVFIDKYTLPNYILPEYPLHEGYEYLSEVHKSDYLRCYFMHHYGGGYSDIKQTLGSWVPFFDKLYSDENIYCIGYAEKSVNDVAILEMCTLNPVQSKYCIEYSTNESGNEWDSTQIRQNWSSLIGNGAYICKKNTKFTKDWLLRLNEKMDGYLGQLKANPARWERDARGHINPNNGNVSEYPIGWSVIHGNIFHPLCLKYKNNIINDLHYPVCINYK